jgi:protein-disulfide isomerase/uncharacterized membrane protein
MEHVMEEAPRPARRRARSAARHGAGTGGDTLSLLFLFLCFAGLFAAGTLSIAHLLDLPVPCGKGGGCAAVAAHPSSKLFGTPVAFFGAAAYAALLVLGAGPAVGRWGRLAAVALTGAGTAVSAGLLVYSRQVIGAHCAWCVASGIIMALLFVLALLAARRGALGGCRPAYGLAFAFLTAGGLGVQAGLMHRASVAPPVPASRLAEAPAAELAGGLKSLGPADAPVTVIEFGDLACPACRAIHGTLLRYRQANPRGVRLVFRHRPLAQIRGHEQSGAAAAVGEVAAEQGRFWEYASRVYALDKAPGGPALLEIAGSLGLDRARLEQRIADPSDPALRRLQDDLDLAERLGIDSTPTFVVILAGQPPRAATARTLPRLLNSPGVLEALLEARGSGSGG